MESSATQWWRGATLYQIYPRSFADSNGDGVGDLPGITARLDYIAGLGVDGIWLSPVFASPQRDFGYDVSDHCAIDPLFGTLNDFDALVRRAHDLGLKVIIDQVWSHTAIEHAWFQESRQDRTNPRADWYVWADPRPDGSCPTNWQSWMGGGTWTWEPRRGQYYLHNFLPQMPDLNFHCPQVQSAILDIARFWLDRGVDGFRLDTVNYYFHDKALRDNPPKPGDTPATMQRHIYNICQPENLAFLGRIRDVLNQYPGRFAVGEIGSDDNLARMIDYTAGDQRLHTAYSFELLSDRCDPAHFRQAMQAWCEGVGTAAWPSWALSNHDCIRVASRWALSAPPDQIARFGLTLLAALRGTIFLYQGEELGLTQADLAFEDIVDPLGKANWPANPGRDGCRTIMPWTRDDPYQGFSTQTPWLPVIPAHRDLSRDQQDSRQGSVLSHARRVIAFRQASPALRLGDFTLVYEDDACLIFRRVHGDGACLAGFNFSGVLHRLDMSLPADIQPQISVGAVRITPHAISLGPVSAFILSLPVSPL
ncbi:oligo-1,6-glucosidase 1 [Candidatus Phycosocius bacilliformis]|uniref:Oligo-1,6-glucosidase 1 n=1 Tax=Candidatus Phycosocius bacilliformis TaxID=1445552 RepID=A0A2P2E742_9PROT|nr:alpha-amylase family glycosyl hydrolase [Candidatus Phycosocius bacilliformis]GBF56870.1 oligo-1,6-glucosidase 1 [Candidatus Phycosocius bacilliformis]